MTAAAPGAAGGALFHVIEPHKMRIFLKVPQDKSGDRSRIESNTEFTPVPK
jgi:hypothetical protein